MLELFDQVQEAVRVIQSRWKTAPRAGIILGTGLGGLVEEITARVPDTAGLKYDSIKSLNGVIQLDKLNATTGVIVTKVAGKTTLETVELP